jgi:hypothetical protein
MRTTYLVILLCTLLYPCKAQTGLLQGIKKDVPLTISGYLVNIYGEMGLWVFQPCNDSSITLADALGNQSFFVQDMINDLGYTYLRDIHNTGRKLPLTLYDHTYNKQLQDTIQYLYCSITILPKSTATPQPGCAYTLTIGNTKKSIACWSLDNYVTNLQNMYAR